VSGREREREYTHESIDPDALDARLCEACVEECLLALRLVLRLRLGLVDDLGSGCGDGCEGLGGAHGRLRQSVSLWSECERAVDSWACTAESLPSPVAPPRIGVAVF
jgi:hypothetical protein